MTYLEECSLDGIPNCLVVSFCSLTNWCDASFEESKKDERNAGISLVRKQRCKSSYVQLHSASKLIYLEHFTIFTSAFKLLKRIS